jgi:hypothetical protein
MSRNSTRLVANAACRSGCQLRQQLPSLPVPALGVDDGTVAVDADAAALLPEGLLQNDLYVDV